VANAWQELQGQMGCLLGFGKGPNDFVLKYCICSQNLESKSTGSYPQLPNVPPINDSNLQLSPTYIAILSWSES
jgi:hypothetical protein